MKILYVTDLHGCQWKYDRVLDAAKRFGARVVLNGGDMFPNGRNLRDEGKFIDGYLADHFAAFDRAGIYYLCLLGNDDLRIFDEPFDACCKSFKHVVNLAQRKTRIGAFEFVGMNWVVDYPFRLKDRCRVDDASYIFQEQYGRPILSNPSGWDELPDWPSYARTLPSIEDELNRLPKPDDFANSVYLIHMPPSGLGLDKCGHGAEVGSRAMTRFFSTHQPRLTLHGHIHESPETSGVWRAELGSTVCIQPGQLAPFTYVTGDLEKMVFKRWTEAR